MSEAVATQTSFDYGSLDATTRREVIAARNRSASGPASGGGLDKL